MSLAPAFQSHENSLDKASLQAKATQAFPYISFKLGDGDGYRSLATRMVADHPITHLIMPNTTADVYSKRAAAHGLQNQFKLIWQLSGTQRIEDAQKSLRLSPGEMMIVPVTRTYSVETEENSEFLLLFFDPTVFPAWQEIVRRKMSKVVGASGAVAAAAAAAGALLRHASSGRADAFAVRSIIDLALSSFDMDEDEEQPRLPPSLHRASHLVQRNIADPTYGPDALAKDLGVSRRSLYSAFGRLGLSPASFIKRQRLDHARNEILSGQNDEVSLSAIALDNGFPDSSSFSHAFKAAYGVPPSALRLRRKLI